MRSFGIRRTEHGEVCGQAELAAESQLFDFLIRRVFRTKLDQRAERHLSPWYILWHSGSTVRPLWMACAPARPPLSKPRPLR